ncbi:MAG: hypothetical protein GWM92_10210 [Gemmatimonadetes bacterium]|nr:hypothetical protein [Gemmatimonadota bacterium]NIR79036.1 hypothetical protein [Gemmatimonadota bacterium]NIT87695.1 hypothetical protein [Gemmatimonadota bacterium]NIU31554.1 hypothetical protein [Gemmatimonadota bacterium]NIU36210.1 hypothetical protein [Gemmatimonadota bacterium]
MKMVVLMYLEDDEEVVTDLLADEGVVAFSRMKMEGHGEGGPGWYGGVAPYRSRMVFAVVGDRCAGRLLGAVRSLGGTADPDHPVRAVEIALEETAASGASPHRPREA